MANCPACDGEGYIVPDDPNLDIYDCPYCDWKEKEKERERKRSIKWSREGEKGTHYRRNYPDSAYHNVVTKKAKFFGHLMYCVLVAGGAPGCFTYLRLRNRTMEEVLDSLLPNDVNFTVTYDGPKDSISKYRKNIY